MQAPSFSLVLALGLGSMIGACSGSDETGTDDDKTADGGASSGTSSGGGGSSSGSSSGTGGGGSSSSSSGAAEPTTVRGKVQVIMNRRCTSCHSGDDAEAQLDLSNVGDAVGKDSFEVPGKTVIVAGEPDESVLVQCIEGDPGGSLGRMPKNAAPLSQTDIDLVRQWISEGAE